MTSRHAVIWHPCQAIPTASQTAAFQRAHLPCCPFSKGIGPLLGRCLDKFRGIQDGLCSMGVSSSLCLAFSWKPRGKHQQVVGAPYFKAPPMSPFLRWQTQIRPWKQNRRSLCPLLRHSDGAATAFAGRGDANRGSLGLLPLGDPSALRKRDRFVVGPMDWGFVLNTNLPKTWFNRVPGETAWD